MKCHYEVLNLSRDSDNSEIKTAYRKLALKWHPDKNLSDPDQAKEQFQLVQQAYEVLSDPHERAWYDNHREQILRGGHTNYEDNSLDVFPYFTTSCFKGYGDGPGGFYAVYSEVFNQIASEDVEYMDNPEDFEQIPKFGNSKSSYEDSVHVFYSYWQSYSTKKSYAWLTTFNPNEVKERRLLKLIDKENKKVQQKAKKERNDEIRNLVQFVRKRDKRVIAQKKLEEERIELNKQKQQALKTEKIKERQREIEQQKLQQSEFISLSDLEKQLRELERNVASEFGPDELSGSNYDSDDNIDESVSEAVGNDGNQISNESGKTEDLNLIDNLYCVACNKSFKNESSIKNHEQSKRHKERTAALIDEMLDEEESYENSVRSGSNSSLSVELEEASDKEVDVDDLEDVDEEEIIQKSNKKSNKTKKSKVQSFPVKNDSISEEDTILKEIIHDSSDDGWDSKKNKKEKKSKQKQKQKTKVEAVVTDNVKTEVKEETIVEKITSNKKSNKEVIQNISINKNDIDLSHDCATCKQKFSSKNKLFSHLKKTGHGVALFTAAATRTNERKNKRKQ